MRARSFAYAYVAIFIASGRSCSCENYSIRRHRLYGIHLFLWFYVVGLNRSVQTLVDGLKSFQSPAVYQSVLMILLLAALTNLDAEQTGFRERDGLVFRVDARLAVFQGEVLLSCAWALCGVTYLILKLKL
jgi:hypothetical protein